MKTIKLIRSICWVWIVAATIAVLFYAPVSVTRRGHAKSDRPVTTIEWIGPFNDPNKPPPPETGPWRLARLATDPVIKSSIDLFRLIVVLFGANFLPVLILRYRRPVTTHYRTENNFMKAIATLLAALAIGAGSLKAQNYNWQLEQQLRQAEVQRQIDEQFRLMEEARQQRQFEAEQQIRHQEIMMEMWRQRQQLDELEWLD